MGFFPTFQNMRSNMSNPEKWLQSFFSGGSVETQAGTTVDQNSATAISAVFSCTTLIAETIAGLPLILYRQKKGGGQERATDHPLYYLLHDQPNPEMTSFSWREAGSGHILLWGNKYNWLKRDKLGRITGIYPKKPDRMTVKRVGGKIGYTHVENGKEKKYAADNMLHVHRHSFDGLIGQSVIVAQREKLGTKKALDKFEALFFSQGTHPSGKLKVEQNLGDSKDQWVKDFNRQYAQLGKSHNVMVLDNGVDYEQIGIPLDQAQFLELTKAKDVDICGCFKVPPHMIGILDRATFSNIEHQAIQFVKNCILPWLRVDEQAMNVKLLTNAERKAGYKIKYLVDGLLRGDAAARGDYYAKLFNMGAMSINDIREKEDMNPIEGGDKHFIQLNMIPIDQAGEIDKPAPETKSRSAEKRSVVIRDRITRQYLPLFRNAAQKIVNLESLALKKQLNKQRKQRASAPIGQWLDTFYTNLPEKIKREVGPVFSSFAEAIQGAAQDETGQDADVSKFVSDYIDRYAERHTESSHGQLTSLLDGELDDLETRVDEWTETRADKIANNETVRASNAVFQQVAFAAGMSTVWRTRGASTCSYCTSLNGKKVASGQSFANSGDELSDGNGGSMKIRGLKTHPPLHAGCDCYVGI